MKNLGKTTVLLLGSIFIFYACTQEPDFILNEASTSLDKLINIKIVNSIDGKDIEISTDYLKEKWEQEISSEEAIKVTLHKFEILQNKTKEGEKTYLLKAKSKDGTINTGTFLILKKDNGGNDFFLLGEKTCTCKGCSSGCELIIDGTRCRCSGCPPGQDCVKTEKVIIKEQ